MVRLTTAQVTALYAMRKTAPLLELSVGLRSTGGFIDEPMTVRVQAVEPLRRWLIDTEGKVTHGWADG